MLNISNQRLSGPQRIIVQDVYNAAVGVYNVSDQTWYNFNLFTAWRNPYYLVFRDYAAYSSPGLLTDLLASYNFNGSSVSSTGMYNGSATAMTYPVGSGKIDKAARFNGTTSQILVGNIPFNNNCSLAFWFRPDATGGATQQLVGTTGTTGGLYFSKATSQIMMNLPTITGFLPGVTFGAYHCVVVSVGVSTYKIWQDGVLVKSGSQTITPVSFTQFGITNGNYPYKGDLDILNFWDKELTPTEAADFYNAGTGIEYPF